MRQSILVIFVVFIIISCQNDTAFDPNINQTDGSVTFSLDMSLAPIDVSQLNGTLSRTGNDTVFFGFRIENQTATALLNNLKGGDWFLNVEALNNQGQLLYQGSTFVRVISGQISTVYLQLNPVTGGLKIVVSWGNQAPAPVAYFPFDGSAHDFSGFENHGSVFGAVLTPDRKGNPKSAYYFDGMDDYIDLTTSRILKPQFPLSVSAWIKVASFDHHNPILTNNYDDGIYNGFWIHASQYHTIAMAFGNGGNAGPYSRRGIVTTDSIEVNTWYHIVGVMRSFNDMEIYINGQKANTEESNGTSLAEQIAYNGSPASIGRTDSTIPPGNTNHFHGTLDEIMLFNKALTEREIINIYNMD